MRKLQRENRFKTWVSLYSLWPAVANRGARHNCPSAAALWRFPLFSRHTHTHTHTHTGSRRLSAVASQARVIFTTPATGQKGISQSYGIMTGRFRCAIFSTGIEGPSPQRQKKMTLRQWSTQKGKWPFGPTWRVSSSSGADIKRRYNKVLECDLCIYWKHYKSDWRSWGTFH